MDGALRRLQDAGDDPAERRLSTARLADQTNDLAFGDGEVDVIHGMRDLLDGGDAEAARQLLGEIGLLDEALRNVAALDQGSHRSGSGRFGWKQRTLRPGAGLVPDGSFMQAASARGPSGRQAHPNERA